MNAYADRGMHHCWEAALTYHHVCLLDQYSLYPMFQVDAELTMWRLFSAANSAVTQDN